MWSLDGGGREQTVIRYVNAKHCSQLKNRTESLSVMGLTFQDGREPINKCMDWLRSVLLSVHHYALARKEGGVSTK